VSHKLPDPHSLSQIAEKIGGENLDEWLALWLASQGGERRNRGFELIASALPFSVDEDLLVLDLCCGPGDLGRVIRGRFPKARVDCVDRDPFLLALCKALIHRVGIGGQTFVRDLWKAGWHEGLSRDYHVVASAAALHWFDVERLTELFGDVFRMLRPGRAFLFAEPHRVEAPFAPGVLKWRKDEWRRTIPDYDPQSWERCWARAEALLGYDHREVLEQRRLDARLSAMMACRCCDMSR
jgi:SAM-dependent methyltransferase